MVIFEEFYSRLDMHDVISGGNGDGHVARVPRGGGRVIFHPGWP